MITKTKFIFIYITCASEHEAKTIAKTLLNEKLIACANFFPIQSMYWWENKIQESNEWVLIAKTTTEKYTTIQQEIQKIHSYSTPCIIKIPIQPNEVYGTWLNQQIHSPSPQKKSS